LASPRGHTLKSPEQLAIEAKKLSLDVKIVEPTDHVIPNQALEGCSLDQQQLSVQAWAKPVPRFEYQRNRERAMGNIIAVREEDKDKPWLATFVKVYHSDAVTQFLIEKFRVVTLPPAAPGRERVHSDGRRRAAASTRIKLRRDCHACDETAAEDACRDRLSKAAPQGLCKAWRRCQPAASAFG
jgi:NlpA lipoprotein